jgi:sortase A
MSRFDALVGSLLAAASLILIGALIVLSRQPDGATLRPASAATRSATPELPSQAAGNTAAPDGVPLVANAGAIARPDSPNRIVIGSIGLDAAVVEVGIVVEDGKPVWDTAAFAVGYHRGSALPGSRGNTVMAGHISSPVSKKGEVFKRLPEVRIGDRVDIYAGEQRATYQVNEIRVVSPSEAHLMNQTPDARLTLITCYPDRDYSRRLVVIGTLVAIPETAERRP